MTTSHDERLAAAVAANRPAGVIAALQAGADPNGQHHYEETRDRECFAGRESWLQFAAREGHAEIVRALLAHGADPDRCDSTRGRSPLAEASARGHAQIVSLLLVARATVHSDAERPDADAFALAIGGGHGDVVDALARAGGAASPRALELACHLGRTDLAALCLQRGAVLAEADALATAARVGSIAMLCWLVDNGADVAATGGDALCEAANAGQTAAVEYLLSIGVSHAHRNAYAWTPLHFAAYQASAATCAALLRAGADPSADDGQQRTPLDWAREAGRADNVELLERALRGA